MIRRWLGSDKSGNLLWLVVSALVATGFWYIAVTSSDPIDRRSFSGIPIRFDLGDEAEITSSSTKFVSVTLQGSQATVSSRRSDDIEVRADLSRLGPGVHSVPLDVTVSSADSGSIRRLAWQTSPSQITVELEPKEVHARGIQIELSSPPPLGYIHGEPELDIAEARISGAASKVSQVVAVRGDLDLSARRNPVSMSLRLWAVDADGNRVADVAVEPQTATVSVSVTRRDDVKQVFVRPDVRLETLPEGFSIKSVSNEPSLLFISGAPEKLEAVADVLYTEPITLEAPEEDFVARVPVQLPDEDLFVMGGDSTILVSIEILADIDSWQIDNIEVGHIGAPAGSTVSIVPKTVSAIVTGPVLQVEALTFEDVQLLVDVAGLEPGVYDLSPAISITSGELSEDNVSLSPAVLNVEISAPPEESAAAEATENAEEPSA